MFVYFFVYVFVDVFVYALEQLLLENHPFGYSAGGISAAMLYMLHECIKLVSTKIIKSFNNSLVIIILYRHLLINYDLLSAEHITTRRSL